MHVRILAAAAPSCLLLLLLAAGCAAPPEATPAPALQPSDGDGVLAACRGQSEALGCYKGHLGRIAAANGADDAMRALAGMEARDVTAAQQSHALSHGIGWAAVGNGSDVRAVIHQCPPSMVSGCIHGALQSYLATQDTVSPDDLRYLCQSTASSDLRAAAQQFNCFHGLGHGLHMLAGQDWRRALDWCRMLGAPNDQFLCAGGLFMENAMGTADHVVGGAGHHHAAPAPPTRWRADDPSYPCREVEDPFALQCWTMQSNLLLQNNGDDWDATLHACDGAGTYVGTCVQGVGREVSAAVSDNPEGVLSLCLKASEPRRGDCVAGAVLAAINVHESFTPALLMCVHMPVELKGACYDAIGVMNGGDPDVARRERVCRDVPDEYKGRCAAQDS